MSRIAQLFVAPILILTCLTSTLSAAPPKNKAKFAITDINQVDEDFALQGEYTGTLSQPFHGQRKLGLQVVAFGEGEFAGMQCAGGLPGDGWDHLNRTKVSGKTTDEGLIMTGDGLAYRVYADHAFVYSGQDYLGRLNKVERSSATLGAAPPENAVVLFAGNGTDQLEGAKVDEVTNLLGVGFTTKMPVGGFRLHVEFRTPYMPYARGQQRGNSGVYIQRRYEVQVLDSFGLEGVANECGGLYRQKAADINMALPPLTWQTYDIFFSPAEFDEQGKRTKQANITVYHNGVAIHYQYDIKNKTGAGKKEGPELMPIHFQNHGNPVAYRNIWLLEQ